MDTSKKVEETNFERFDYSDNDIDDLDLDLDTNSSDTIDPNIMVTKKDFIKLILFV